MLGAYYDISMKDFSKLFEELWIGKEENWTHGKNQYYVLYLDFSIQINGTEEEEISKLFHKQLNDQLQMFITQYQLTSITVNQSNSFSTYTRIIGDQFVNKDNLITAVSSISFFLNY